MSAEQDKSKWPDPGLAALVMLLRFHGIGADPAQICHRFGTGPIGIPEILLCAREFGLKARSRRTNWTRLVNTPLPAIVVLRDGGFLLLGKVGDDKALVQSPMSPDIIEGQAGPTPRFRTIQAKHLFLAAGPSTRRHGGTFLPFKALRGPRTTTLRPRSQLCLRRKSWDQS
jgi:hypothetical protein